MQATSGLSLRKEGVGSGNPQPGGDVATLTQDAIRSLACFKVPDARVVSLYLDVDGRRYVRPKDYEQQLEHLLRQVRERENGSSPTEDLRRIESHVKAGFDRSHTRG